MNYFEITVCVDDYGIRIAHDGLIMGYFGPIGA